MNGFRLVLCAALSALVGLGGCATRPVNPPISHANAPQFVGPAKRPSPQQGDKAICPEGRGASVK